MERGREEGKEMSAFTVLSANELRDKGITKSQVAGMLRRAEARCNWFSARYAATGSVSVKEQTEWDTACARWDHIKATLHVLSVHNAA